MVEDLLPWYRAVQWTSFTFGVIALALGIIYFRGVGVCTPQPASISEIEKGECLDEQIPSPGNTYVARTSSEKKKIMVTTIGKHGLHGIQQNKSKKGRKRYTSGVCMDVILHNIY